MDVSRKESKGVFRLRRVFVSRKDAKKKRRKGICTRGLNVRLLHFIKISLRLCDFASLRETKTR